MGKLKVNESAGGQMGHWKLDVYKGDVQSKETYLETIEGYNLITTVGKEFILDRLVSNSRSVLSRIGVGTSGTSANVANTSLSSSYFKVYDSLPTRIGRTLTFITTFGTSDANLNWQELGMDNGTTLLNRIAPIGPFNKTSAVSIVVTVTVTQN